MLGKWAQFSDRLIILFCSGLVSPSLSPLEISSSRLASSLAQMESPLVLSYSNPGRRREGQHLNRLRLLSSGKETLLQLEMEKNYLPPVPLVMYEILGWCYWWWYVYITYLCCVSLVAWSLVYYWASRLFFRTLCACQNHL